MASIFGQISVGHVLPRNIKLPGRSNVRYTWHLMAQSGKNDRKTKISPMKNLMLLKLVFVLSAIQALGFDPPHTPEQIQQQKNLAKQKVIEGVPADFRTPLSAFEKYYAGLVAGDASEFACLTEKAIEAWLGPGELTPEQLQRIRDGNAERDERDQLLGEFVFKEDPDRPEITFGYRYTFKGADGERITRVERMRIVFIRTPQGWRIDEIEDDPPV